MKVLIINNLASGYREGSVYDFMRSFVEDGDEVCLRSSDGTTSIDRLLDDAEEFDAVVASGGDGTIATVAYRLRGTGVPVLPYPAGTANLLSLNLLEPNEPHALAKLARSGKTLDFDMGEIEKDGKTFGFMIMAGAGYDATIMESAAPNKKLLGPVAYFLAAGSNIAPQHSKITLVIDGEKIETEGMGVLLVNFSQIQFGIPVTHSNQPRDGKLGIVVLKAKNAVELLPSVFAAMLDRDGHFPDRGEALDIYSGKHVEVAADPAFEIQYDGETTGATTPFAAHALPQTTRLIVSDEAYELFK
ncbi:diacylglycerol kinase [Slackia faecicanis]|uniref:Diacylglycerol kinase n=1 Tax=Slackia faecicanis TaxID=255723 RepID=A0A3N0AHF6_9ACTN|nr:diacylglycerol kinase family protein [Slackia faecicanis]MDO5357844.1 diacylglycerol kinase family protein [Slackia faecicanis]RNL21495.1 diacylglycerol kinase [Slackia faecicanis]